MQKRNRVVAVIPARNEENHIKKVVEETRGYVDIVLVVDDASVDNTGILAKKAGAIVLRHVVNLGLGGSLKTGCDAALLLGAKEIITLDGDGQHDPHEIPKLLFTLRKNKVDAVFGERRFNADMPLFKRIGNYFFHLYSKYFFGIKIKDTQTGFRLLTAEAYKKIRWNSRDYAVASEMLINAERERLNYASQHVTTIYHDEYKGTTILDGVKIANKMLQIKLR